MKQGTRGSKVQPVKRLLISCAVAGAGAVLAQLLFGVGTGGAALIGTAVGLLDRGFKRIDAKFKRIDAKAKSSDTEPAPSNRNF